MQEGRGGSIFIKIGRALYVYPSVRVTQAQWEAIKGFQAGAWCHTVSVLKISLWRKLNLEMRQIGKLVHWLQQEVKVAWTRVIVVGGRSLSYV